jgi:hypothetical protein
MEIKIMIAVISGFVAIIVAFLTYYLTKKKEINLKELEFKLEKYNDFLSGFSEIGSGYKTYEAHNKVANSTNLLNLIASKEVLEKTFSLFEYVENHSDESFDIKEQNRLTDEIIISMRKDLKQNYNKLKGFKFKLMSPGIRPGEVIKK